MITKIEELITENTPASALEILRIITTAILYQKDEDDIEDGRNPVKLLSEIYNYNSSKNSFNGISLEIVDSVGGGEGEGESVCDVYAVVKDSEFAEEKYNKKRIAGTIISYIEVTGFYESDNGTEWDNEANFVYPKEVTVIQYQRTK